MFTVRLEHLTAENALKEVRCNDLPTQKTQVSATLCAGVTAGITFIAVGYGAGSRCFTGSLK